jgi:hypothetical protein
VEGLEQLFFVFSRQSERNFRIFTSSGQGEMPSFCFKDAQNFNLLFQIFVAFLEASDGDCAFGFFAVGLLEEIIFEFKILDLVLKFCNELILEENLVDELALFDEVVAVNGSIAPLFLCCPLLLSPSFVEFFQTQLQFLTFCFDLGPQYQVLLPCSIELKSHCLFFGPQSSDGQLVVLLSLDRGAPLLQLLALNYLIFHADGDYRGWLLPVGILGKVSLVVTSVFATEMPKLRLPFTFF